jgi:UDP-N-acetylglucosamine--N-acetylmuramyl-(pentapeptide) pyrophosphoryl-undecaprenol N-acetylglucosamine transferase
MRQYKFILSGWRTGGHIYPVACIANELKLRFLMRISFVGAKDKMEMQKVPQAGLSKLRFVAGLQGQITLQK